jgi:hypothetical protein
MQSLTCTCTLDGIVVEADIVITSYHPAERPSTDSPGAPAEVEFDVVALRFNGVSVPTDHDLVFRVAAAVHDEALAHEERRLAEANADHLADLRKLVDEDSIAWRGCGW